MDGYSLMKRGLVLTVVCFFLGFANIQAVSLGIPFDDITPPVTTATMDPEFHNGWYPLPVWVTLNATDNESGVNVTYYKIDNGGWVLYAHPFVIVDDGIFVVQFSSVDNAGNVEAAKQVEIKIDDEAPITHSFLDPSVPNGMNGWYVSDIWLTLNATDNESGVKYIYCSASPGGIYTGPVLITGEGTQSISVFSVDNVNNIGLTACVPIFKIDKTAPLISMNYTWEKVGAVYNIIITAICSDPMSGMAKVEFYFNGVLQETVTGAGPDYVWSYNYVPGFNVTIKAIAWDCAGNFAEAELINPHSSSAQSQSQSIQNFILRHHTMNGILLGLKKVNQ